MGQEIERKFLLAGEGWRGLAEGVPYCQGYIATRDRRTVRVRLVGAKGYLTLKGPALPNRLGRPEFEYEIPLAEAQEILETLCDRPIITKVRYKIAIGDLLWEVDEFAGENAGLILAEVELQSEDQPVPLPDWVGLEVTGDRRYYNSYLVKHPFQSWPA
ncbi:MAG: CYTH domain-containing protein [Synechococcales cyanobacterium RM1_1_8]|nr:CYTH domain-containing protein [Synechococcales cyanobacterium RM1_1_8]